LQTCAGRERVPIIDRNKRRNKNRPLLYPAKKERYKIRATVEVSGFIFYSFDISCLYAIIDSKYKLTGFMLKYF